MLTELFVDDDVSGSTSLAERPAGKRLLAVANSGVVVITAKARSHVPERW